MCFSLAVSAVSSFFAQVIGFYLFFICLAMLLQPQRFKKIMTEVLAHPASLFVCAATNILFSLVVLVPHNLWVANWQVLITIIAWLALLKGLVTLFFPERYVNMSKNLMSKQSYQVWTWVWLLIALFLVWMGLSTNT
ncbi:MAG: hypothetical protein HW387_1630 [Parachlamydiales bacterium]|nr:hypothetical protein [Parachlamydiales bacterium]